MAERKLGRGLDVLIGREAQQRRAVSAGRVPIALIRMNPRQPRERSADDSIRELALSIQEVGLMQPVVVRPVDGGYELVAGERRLRACRALGWESIPAVIREVAEDRSLELALIENVQRKDLTPIEQAKALRELMDTFELTQEELAARIGKRRSTVANLLRLLELPEDIQALVSRGTLSMGHARAVAGLPGNTTKRALVREILAGSLSVRAAEERARRIQERAGRSPREKPPYIVELEQKLSESLGLRVEVRDRAGKGRITIHFRDGKEFDRAFARLMGAGRAAAGS